MLANLFVVGAVKGGTTSLYTVLKKHKDINMSPLKEPHYFSKNIDIKKFRKEYRASYVSDDELEKYLAGEMCDELFLAFIGTEMDYQKLFKKRNNEKYLGEVSPSYLYSQIAAKNIYEYNRKAKIIIYTKKSYRTNFFTLSNGFKNGVCERTFFR